jgi:hypothetical protein
MLRTFAAIVAIPSMIVLAVPANAEPNYETFLQAIAGDGIVMDGNQAIVEGHGVCTLMQPPNGGSLWDATQQLKSKHPDWTLSSAMAFADRSIQDICPDRGGSF